MKLMTIIKFRLIAVTGGIKTIVFLLVALSFCFFVADSIANLPTTRNLVISVVDLDESLDSMELVKQLQSMDGVTIYIGGLSEAQILLARGNVDGILTIGEGYSDALRNDATLPLVYDSSSSATTQTTAREIIAGQVIAARSMARAYNQLEKEGVVVDSYKIAELLAEFNANANPLYNFSIHAVDSGTRHYGDRILTGYIGFVALVIILTMMTLSQWFSQPDSRKVSTRITSLIKGRELSYFSDTILLLVIGSVITLLAYIVSLNSLSLSFVELMYLFAYMYCITGICLALSKLQESGAIDIMAPLIALSTSILGGSFVDLSTITPGLRTVALFTPQGQMLHGIQHGALWPLLILVLAGSVLLFVGYPKLNKQ